MHDDHEGECGRPTTPPAQNPTQADQGIYKVVAKNPHGEHKVEQNYTAVCVANEVFKTQ